LRAGYRCCGAASHRHPPWRTVEAQRPVLPWARPGRLCCIWPAHTGATRGLHATPALRSRVGRRPRCVALLPQFPLATGLWPGGDVRWLRNAPGRVGRVGHPWGATRVTWTSQGIPGARLTRGTWERSGRAGMAGPWAHTPTASGTTRSACACTGGASASLGHSQGGSEPEHGQQHCEGFSNHTEHRFSPIGKMREISGH
jgi:hypothetical protein